MTRRNASTNTNETNPTDESKAKQSKGVVQSTNNEPPLTVQQRK
eukprot:CAMPEP_0206120982 /NCGR_PEP_ID=MMETSP1472-20131121/1064_1 /ASSEMBLY_ACC=CAM_ASM_001108 /TAXON_ID=41880 /ORGANISM="Pycnococcus provasolii, Strain RCC251" /LENGTH=43 /DNA_ID= /DNA_START= /DNA_END= /DNA_ORIENTATION=